MFEGITCVYKSNVDLLFYVFGSASENELILASVRSPSASALIRCAPCNYPTARSSWMGVATQSITLSGGMPRCCLLRL